MKNKRNKMCVVAIVSMFLFMSVGVFTAAALEDSNEMHDGVSVLIQDYDAIVEISYFANYDTASLSIDNLGVYNKKDSGIFRVKVEAHIDIGLLDQNFLSTVQIRSDLYYSISMRGGSVNGCNVLWEEKFEFGNDEGTGVICIEEIYEFELSDNIVDKRLSVRATLNSHSDWWNEKEDEPWLSRWVTENRFVLEESTSEPWSISSGLDIAKNIQRLNLFQSRLFQRLIARMPLLANIF